MQKAAHTLCVSYVRIFYIQVLVNTLRLLNFVVKSFEEINQHHRKPPNVYRWAFSSTLAAQQIEMFVMSLAVNYFSTQVFTDFFPLINRIAG